MMFQDSAFYILLVYCLYKIIVYTANTMYDRLMKACSVQLAHKLLVEVMRERNVAILLADL